MPCARQDGTEGIGDRKTHIEWHRRKKIQRSARVLLRIQRCGRRVHRVAVAIGEGGIFLLKVTAVGQQQVQQITRR